MLSILEMENEKSHRVYNPKVRGSNPVPAAKLIRGVTAFAVASFINFLLVLWQKNNAFFA